MATCLCHQNGIMECWNAGILGVMAEINHFNWKKLLQNHHSITPLFQLGLPARAPGRLALLSWRASLQWQAGRSP
jgi:hypothetical protein